MRILSALFLLLFVACADAPAQEGTSITFKAPDGLSVTADIYNTGRDLPWILLCHQAGYSRGEYLKIAPKLNALGFNCVAIDQRSGNEVNGVENRTAMAAKRAGTGTSYGDAVQDIVQAIQYTSKLAGGKQIILWGSSYSAALACKIGKENPQVYKVVAFSPGEYIKGVNITQAVAGIGKPIFVTSSREEAKAVSELVKGVEPNMLTHFAPQEPGVHGSRALWENNDNHAAYWDALRKFLATTP